MLLQIHDKSRMPIQALWRLIFMFTFEKENTAHCTRKVIEEQLLKWNGFITINKARYLEQYGLDPDTQYVAVGTKGSILDELEYQLGMMCSWVVREEKGEFESKIEAYKRAEIDYRLAEPMCFAFPEVQSKRNFKKAARLLRANMEEYPEVYKNIKNYNRISLFFKDKGQGSNRVG